MTGSGDSIFHWSNAFCLSPPVLNEPILLFLVDPEKVVGSEICGMNIAGI
jgi:hypothetical protein